MQEHPKVSIITLNWKRLNDILECLTSLTRMDYPHYEIIVVDNASDDGSPEAIKRSFPGVILIKNEENLGVCGGNNRGIEYALKNSAQYVWLVNNDITAEKDTLHTLVAAAESSPDIGMVSPVIYDYFEPERLQYCGSYANRRHFFMHHLKSLDELDSQDVSEVTLWGTAVLIKRAVIEKIGYLDEAFFIYQEDFDYSLRSLEAGFVNRIEPSAKIYHKPHSKNANTSVCAGAGLPLHYFYYMNRNEYRLWMKHLQGVWKLKCLRSYLMKMLRQAADFSSDSMPEVSDVCLDGMYCALRNIWGIWDRNIVMPKVLKTALLSGSGMWISILEAKPFRFVVNKLRELGHKIAQLTRELVESEE